MLPEASHNYNTITCLFFSLILLLTNFVTNKHAGFQPIFSPPQLASLGPICCYLPYYLPWLSWVATTGKMMLHLSVVLRWRPSARSMMRPHVQTKRRFHMPVCVRWWWLPVWALPVSVLLLSWLLPVANP